MGERRLYCPACGRVVSSPDASVPNHFRDGAYQQSGMASSGGPLVPFCPGSGRLAWGTVPADGGDEVETP